MAKKQKKEMKKQKKQLKKKQKKARKELQKHFLSACEKMDFTPSIPNVEGVPHKYQQKIIDHYMMMVVADSVLNEIKDEIEEALITQK